MGSNVSKTRSGVLQSWKNETVIPYLQSLDHSKEYAAEERCPQELVCKHLGNNSFIALRLVWVHLAVKECIPEMTCRMDTSMS